MTATIDDIARRYNIQRASDLPPKPAFDGAADSRARQSSPDRSAGHTAGAANAAALLSSERSEGVNGQREESAPESAKWTKQTKKAFDVLRPAALALVASNGPLSVTLWGPSGVVQRIGQNRAVWPAKVARSGAWKDTVTATHDHSPFYFIGAQFRVWCANEQKRDRLAEATVELISRRADEEGGLDELRRGFQDLGPDLDLALFELEVHAIAERLGFVAWSDDGLARFLARVAERVEAERLAGRGLADEMAAYDLAAAKEMLAQGRGRSSGA